MVTQLKLATSFLSLSLLMVGRQDTSGTVQRSVTHAVTMEGIAGARVEVCRLLAVRVRDIEPQPRGRLPSVDAGSQHQDQHRVAGLSERERVPHRPAAVIADERSDCASARHSSCNQ